MHRHRTLAVILVATLAYLTGPGTGPAAAAPEPEPLRIPGSTARVAPFSDLGKKAAPHALRGFEKAPGLALGPAPAGTAAAAPAAPGRTRPLADAGTAAEPWYCDSVIDENHNVGTDESGAQIFYIEYYGDVACNFYLAAASGAAGVIDRTPGYERVLDVGNTFYFENGYFGFSTGDYEVNGDTYAGARSVEVVVELYLLTPDAIPWGGCNDIPGLYYLLCEGVGTDLLHVILGAGEFQTGLTAPCRDRTIPYNDPELDRISATVPGNTTVPVSQRILDANPDVRARVNAFETVLCTQTSLAGAQSLATSSGQQLWDTAVSAAKAGNLDDRALYWARLRMNAAIKQWLPPFTLADSQRTELMRQLDRASRGMNDDAFGSATRKVFVTGFDPFGLSDPRLGNPSGAAVLRLDDTQTTIGGQSTEIQAVIFPVRYADFNNGIVGDVFLAKENGAKQATFIVTTSQGNPGRFDLEVYNGRNRSAGIDNQNVSCGCSESNPVRPPQINQNEPQFTLSTLPINAMQVGSTLVIVDKTVKELPYNNSTPTLRTNGPTMVSTAVAGSGDGFLSNELPYRVTRIRDQFLPDKTVPAGHIHVPYLNGPAGNANITDAAFENTRRATALQFETMLTAGVAAGKPAPLRLTLDKTTYRVGESPQYTVTGAPANGLIVWSSARGNPPMPTLEVDAYYGHVADANGTWSGAGGPWTASDVGPWTKQVRLDGVTATVDFTVIP